MKDQKIHKNLTLGELLSKYPEAQEILKRFSINLDTVENSATIEEVCEKQDQDVEEVVDTLNDILDEDYSSFSDVEEDE